MFVIDATTDYAEAVDRLARLMYNIECGSEIYEWKLGSSEKAKDTPKINFLSISVPGVTTAAPPMTAVLRPSVGVVYFVPGVELEGLITKVKTLLDSFPDSHLRGYLPVEITPHATLLHCNRIQEGSSIGGSSGLRRSFYTKGRNSHLKAWRPSHLCPTRLFHLPPLSKILKPPIHISVHAAFTWYFLPISVAFYIRSFHSFAEFNAIVAGVFLDSFLGGKESAEPIYSISADFFNIPATPPGITKAAQAASSKALFICHNGRIHLCGANLRECCSNWSPIYRQRSARLESLRLANVSPGPIGDGKCGICQLPLWGVIYAITDPLIAPYHLAVCTWCAGCLPAFLRNTASQAVLPLTMAEAYRESKYADLLPLLEAEVTAFKVRSKVFFRILPPAGKKNAAATCSASTAGYFLEPGDDSGIDLAFEAVTPLCLRYPELHSYREPSLVCHNLIQVLSS
ncbi:hypothetical protein ElyMa_002524200 [Elysia marginata]|uniref:Protein kinase A anchor protein nuclear localisation signal domain-containing protein n=1 Tax=Elysia marginata TaxID=1093978 RepID=A0AAV4GVW9_9GAST|nr:hypothetical protein ElyMa_002524200 [Elysia marginata]